MGGDSRERGFGGGDEGVGPPAGEIAAAEELEIAELGGLVHALTGPPRLAQQIEVVTDEEHHALAHQTFEQVGAELGVAAGVDGFAYIVEERCGPELTVFGRGTRVLEDLERMEEGVAFGMIARRLRHAIEITEEVEEIEVSGASAWIE